MDDSVEASFNGVVMSQQRNHRKSNQGDGGAVRDGITGAAGSFESFM